MLKIKIKIKINSGEQNHDIYDISVAILGVLEVLITWCQGSKFEYIL